MLIDWKRPSKAGRKRKLEGSSEPPAASVRSGNERSLHSVPTSRVSARLSKRAKVLDQSDEYYVDDDNDDEDDDNGHENEDALYEDKAEDEGEEDEGEGKKKEEGLVRTGIDVPKSRRTTRRSSTQRRRAVGPQAQKQRSKRKEDVGGASSASQRSRKTIRATEPGQTQTSYTTLDVLRMDGHHVEVAMPSTLNNSSDTADPGAHHGNLTDVMKKTGVMLINSTPVRTPARVAEAQAKSAPLSRAPKQVQVKLSPAQNIATIQFQWKRDLQDALGMKYWPREQSDDDLIAKTEHAKLSHKREADLNPLLLELLAQLASLTSNSLEKVVAKLGAVVKKRIEKNGHRWAL